MFFCWNIWLIWVWDIWVLKFWFVKLWFVNYCGEIINVNFLFFNLLYCDVSLIVLIKFVELLVFNKNVFLLVLCLFNVIVGLNGLFLFNLLELYIG